MALFLMDPLHHYLVHTDPTLRGPLTNSGCTYASYFTSAVTLEVKVEQSLEMGAEQSSNSKSGAEWSSNLEVGWNLEQWKCEMGHPLIISRHSQHLPNIY